MLKEKLTELKKISSSDHPVYSQIKMLKQEVYKEAVTDLVAYCTCGMRFYPQHVQSMSSIIAGDLLNEETRIRLKSILFNKMDYCEYEDFLKKEREIAEKMYKKYFHSYTKILNGRIYNEILGMYWTENSLWEIEEDGWHKFTAFMPYT